MSYIYIVRALYTLLPCLAKNCSSAFSDIFFAMSQMISDLKMHLGRLQPRTEVFGYGCMSVCACMFAFSCFMWSRDFKTNSLRKNELSSFCRLCLLLPGSHSLRMRPICKQLLTVLH